MATPIVSGTTQVQAYQRALGGELPDTVSLQEAAERRFAERIDRGRLAEQRAQQPSLIEHPLNRVLLDHPEVAEQVKVAPRSLDVRKPEFEFPQRVLGSPEASIYATASGIQLFKTPPYDYGLTYPANTQYTSAWAVPDFGDYGLVVGSNGGYESAWSGVGVWFYATSDNPVQRFAATIEYAYSWWIDARADTSVGAWTYLSVWSNTDQAYVVESAVSPRISGGGSYLDHKSEEDSGTVSSEAHFAARAGNWYMGLVECFGFAVAGSGFLGTGSAQISFTGRVPLVVFGELF